jgi:hypothetical protein
MNMSFIIILLAQCLTISSGTLDGKVVGPGTFCPAPFDAELAKRIVDKDATIEILQTKLNSCNKQSDRVEKFYVEQDKKKTEFYESNIKDLTFKLEVANGWWNAWGKPLLVGLASAAVAAFGTYEVVK